MSFLQWSLWRSESLTNYLDFAEIYFFESRLTQPRSHFKISITSSEIDIKYHRLFSCTKGGRGLGRSFCCLRSGGPRHLQKSSWYFYDRSLLSMHCCCCCCCCVVRITQGTKWSLSCSTWTRTWWKSGSQGGRRGKGGGLRFFIFAYIIIINGGGFHLLHHIAITSVNEVIKRAGVGNAILLLIIIVSCLSWWALHTIFLEKVCSSSEQIWEDTSWREEDTVLSGSFYFNVYSRCTL